MAVRERRLAKVRSPGKLHKTIAEERLYILSRYDLIGRKCRWPV